MSDHTARDFHDDDVHNDTDDFILLEDDVLDLESIESALDALAREESLQGVSIPFPAPRSCV